MADKARAKAQEIKGKVKESIGEDTSQGDLARKGRADQRKANLKQAGEKLKRAVSKKKDR